MLVKNFWLIAALLFAPYAAAQVSKSTVLLCTPKTESVVNDSGETVTKKPGWLLGDKMLIDLGSGLVRQPQMGGRLSGALRKPCMMTFPCRYFSTAMRLDIFYKYIQGENQ